MTYGQEGGIVSNINSEAPTPAMINASASAVVVEPNQALTLQASAADDTEIMQYRWDLGDGREVGGAEAQVSYSEAGSYVVWAQAVSAAGDPAVAEPLHILVTPRVAEANLDTTPPEGTLQAPVATAQPTVTLRLSLAEGIAATGIQMRFSSDGQNYSAWEAFAAERVWSLAEDEGSVALFAQLRNELGVIATPLAAVLLYDTTPPSITLGPALNDPEQPREVSISWAVEDLGTEAHGILGNEYQLVGVDTDWQQAGAEQVATYSNLQAGTYVLKVRVTDQAGNVGLVEGQVVVDIPAHTTYLPLVQR